MSANILVPRHTFGDIEETPNHEPFMAHPSAQHVPGFTFRMPGGVASTNTALYLCEGRKRGVAYFEGDSYKHGHVKKLSRPGFDVLCSTAEGLLSGPQDLALIQGKLFVADSGNKRVYVFSADELAPLSYFSSCPADEILSSIHAWQDELFSLASNRLYVTSLEGAAKRSCDTQVVPSASEEGGVIQYMCVAHGRVCASTLDSIAVLTLDLVLIQVLATLSFDLGMLCATVDGALLVVEDNPQAYERDDAYDPETVYAYVHTFRLRT